MLRFSLPEVMDWLSFDRVQVKGEVLKAVRMLLARKLSWSLGLTAMQGYGVEKWEEWKHKAVGGPDLCKYSKCRDTVPQNTPHIQKVTSEGWISKKWHFLVLHANRCPKQMWDRMKLLPWLYFQQHIISSLFQLSHTYSHPTQSFEALRKIPTE